MAPQALVKRFEARNQPYLDLQLRLASMRAFSMPVLGLSGLVLAFSCALMPFAGYLSDRVPARA